jgi:hypothetical protein
MIDITISKSMDKTLRKSRYTGHIIAHGRELAADGLADDLVTAFTYGALCAVTGIVLTAPTRLDRLQGDYFWQGVTYGENLTD